MTKRADVDTTLGHECGVLRAPAADCPGGGAATTTSAGSSPTAGRSRSPARRLGPRAAGRDLNDLEVEALHADAG